MSLNFFKDECQHEPINIETFGLCDDDDNNQAYPDTNIDNQDDWIATVKNTNNLDIVFTAIDKCVLKDGEFPNRGRCDCMLTTDQHLYLVELKNQKPPWQSNAVEQLKSTIQFLLEKHDISSFNKKKAFACNKKKGKFVFIDNEENLMMYRKTGFRIDIQSEVLII